LLVSTQHLPVILWHQRVYASPFLHFFAGAASGFVLRLFGPMAGRRRMHKTLDFIGRNGCHRPRQVNWLPAGYGMKAPNGAEKKKRRDGGFIRFSASHDREPGRVQESKKWQPPTAVGYGFLDQGAAWRTKGL
jgi:hypothetical protein